MDTIWLWPLALVAVLVAWPALRPLAARLFSDQLRPQALGEQPDHIYLVRVGDPQWRHDDARKLAETQLASAGFAEAGVYVVREMPRLTLGLHAQVSERAYAILYDHPGSGFWAEFVTRYEDGTIATFTSLEAAEVDLPEGSVLVSEPRLSPTLLWKRFADTFGLTGIPRSRWRFTNGARSRPRATPSCTATPRKRAARPRSRAGRAVTRAARTAAC